VADLLEPSLAPVNPFLPSTILRVLLVASTFALAPSCHSETLDQAPSQHSRPQETTRKDSRPTPIPTVAPISTPTPSITPSAPNQSIAPSSPRPTGDGASPAPVVTEPVKLPAKEAIQVQAQIQPVEVKPLGIQPVQVQLPKEDLHLTASGIPDKIKVEWEVKPVPLDLRWPKDALKISIDLTGALSKLKESEWKTRLDEQNNECKKQIDELTKRLENERVRQLTQQRESYREEIARQVKLGNLPLDQSREIMQKLDLPVTKPWAHPLLILLYIFFSGLLGGFSISVVDFLRQQRNHEQESAKVEAILGEMIVSPKVLQQSPPYEKGLVEEGQRVAEQDPKFSMYLRRQMELKTLLTKRWPPRSEWLPSVLLGIVASLLVPAVLHVARGVKLQDVADNAYALVTLCSFCFAFAMLGEPFIDLVLRKLLKLTKIWSNGVRKSAADAPSGAPRDQSNTVEKSEQ
jgi:hypothetical protein